MIKSFIPIALVVAGHLPAEAGAESCTPIENPAVLGILTPIEDGEALEIAQQYSGDSELLTCWIYEAKDDLYLPPPISVTGCPSDKTESLGYFLKACPPDLVGAIIMEHLVHISYDSFMCIPNVTYEFEEVWKSCEEILTKRSFRNFNKLWQHYTGEKPLF